MAGMSMSMSVCVCVCVSPPYKNTPKIVASAQGACLVRHNATRGSPLPHGSCLQQKSPVSFLQSAAYLLPIPDGLPISTKNYSVNPNNPTWDYRVRLQSVRAVDDLVDAVSE